MKHIPYPMPVPAGRSTALVPHTQFQPPKRRPPRRELFEGDAAIIELRYRLTEGHPGEHDPGEPYPSQPYSREHYSPEPFPRDPYSRDPYPGALPALYTEPPPYRRPANGSLRAALGYAGAVLIAATTAGATGFIAGHVKHAAVASMSPGSVQPMRPLAAPAAPAAAAPRRDLDAASRRMVADAVTGKRNLDPAPRMIAAEAVPGRRPGELPLPPAQYLADSAPRMRLGAELMKAGDVAAARTMFERVAEAGNPDGAFALAETYDPAVLRSVPLRGGGITADTAQARRWYEKARDMGSSTAPERIVRLRVASKK